MGQQPTLADYLQRRLNLIHEIRAWIRRPESVPAWRKRKREILRLATVLEDLAVAKEQSRPSRIATLVRRANRYKNRLEIGTFLPGDGPGHTETVLRVTDDFQEVAADRLTRIAVRLKSKAKCGPKDHLRAVGELVVSDLYHKLRKVRRAAYRPIEDKYGRERTKVISPSEHRLLEILGENLLEETTVRNHWRWVSKMLYDGRIDGAKIRKRTAVFERRHGYRAVRFWKECTWLDFTYPSDDELPSRGGTIQVQSRPQNSGPYKASQRQPRA